MRMVRNIFSKHRLILFNTIPITLFCRYVKDFDCYQKALLERYKIDNPTKKSRKRNSSGCLCFPGKSRRDDADEKSKEIIPVVPLT